MNRIDQKFIDLKKQGKPAFMPFVVGGDPDFKTSLKIVATLCKHADFLEIGFPYSDPLADGPTIQAADIRALNSGATTDSIFDLIKKIRQFSQVPITVLVFANLVLQKGVSEFYKIAKNSGVDGVLIPDAPVEEIDEFAKIAEENGIRQIFLVSQLTTNLRLKKILKHAKGFLYLVSVLGVTGARKSFGKETAQFIKRIRGQTNLPLCVGFGISTPNQFKEMIKAGANGVIVGSALVDVIAKNLKQPNMFKQVENFAKKFSNKDYTQ